MPNVPAYDLTGAPLAGLSPTWSVYLDATTGTTSAGPTITDATEGQYTATPTSDDHAGIVDFGATASPRYVHVGAVNVATFAAFGSDGAPLAGLTPTWAAWTGTDPAITELSGGLYKIASTTDSDTGILDLGATAFPRYLAVDEFSTASSVDATQPAVGSISPAAASALTSLQEITFTVTDSAGNLARVVVLASFASGLEEVVHDGSAFSSRYSLASSRTATATGYSYGIVRSGGWAEAPTLTVIAYDDAGNSSVTETAWTLATPEESALVAWMNHAGTVVEALTPRTVSQGATVFTLVDGLLEIDDEPMVLDRHFDVILVDSGSIRERWGDDYSQRRSLVDIALVYDRAGNRRSNDVRVHEDVDQITSTLESSLNYGSSRIQRVTYTGKTITPTDGHRVDVRLSLEVICLEAAS